MHKGKYMYVEDEKTAEIMSDDNDTIVDTEKNQYEV